MYVEFATAAGSLRTDSRNARTAVGVQPTASCKYWFANWRGVLVSPSRPPHESKHREHQESGRARAIVLGESEPGTSGMQHGSRALTRGRRPPHARIFVAFSHNTSADDTPRCTGRGLTAGGAACLLRLAFAIGVAAVALGVGLADGILALRAAIFAAGSRTVAGRIRAFLILSHCFLRAE